MPKLIALQPFRYNHRALVAGDPFDAPRQQARALIAIGRAEAAPAGRAPAAKAKARSGKASAAKASTATATADGDGPPEAGRLHLRPAEGESAPAAPDEGADGAEG